MSDTLFIVKNITKEDAHFVFWETNKDSKFYKIVPDSKMNRFERDTYLESLNQLRSNKTVFKKFNLKGLAKEWIILQVYQGKICLYSPNDYYSHFMLQFTDSTMIYRSGEGPKAMPISQIQQVNPHHYEFIIKDRINKVEVNLVDKEKGIAVFTFNQTIVSNGHTETRIWHSFMIDKAKMRKVPFIVNYSLNSKAFELDFDEVDFSKTIQEKKLVLLKDHASDEKKAAMLATTSSSKLPPSCFIKHRKNIIPIIYGYITPELFEKSKKKLIYIGGDMLTGCDPKYYCTIDKIAF
ncbi:MAG: hypothetical protein K2X37_03370 [Chitinophagaceae bacterium]|nr:hypothetical protein [Chitinophagaceae bacterium]